MKLRGEGTYGRHRSTASRATRFTLTAAGLALAAAVLFAGPGSGQSVDRAAPDPPERQSEPSWSPDGTRIAFRGGAFPDVDIWLADADGSNPVRLTDHPAADGYPVWAPDGGRLAFVSNRDGVWKLYLMDADGSNLRELATTSERDADPARPAWTPDGEKVVIRVREPDENTRIVVVGADGGEARTIQTPERADWPDVAPDGSLVFSAPDGDGIPQIWVTRPGGTDARPITDGSGRKSLPRVTADGLHVIYVNNLDGTPLGWEIVRSRLDGSDTQQLTDDDYWKFYPEPSPDGGTVLFVTIRDGMTGPAQLRLMDADGSNDRPFFDSGS